MKPRWTATALGARREKFAPTNSHHSSTLTHHPDLGGIPNDVADLLATIFSFTLANKCVALYCYVPQVAFLSRRFQNMNDGLPEKVGGEWLLPPKAATSSV
jgi:hypothetical protein